MDCRKETMRVATMDDKTVGTMDEGLACLRAVMTDAKLVAWSADCWEMWDCWMADSSGVIKVAAKDRLAAD